MTRTNGLSLCSCGHVGDIPGPDLVKRTPAKGATYTFRKNEHAGTQGHGLCLHQGCTCGKFRWQRYLEPRDA